MLYTGSASIRDVLLFPYLRPEAAASSGAHAGSDADGDDEQTGNAGA